MVSWRRWKQRGGERLYSSKKKITTKSRCPLTKERIKQIDEMKWGLPFIVLSTRKNEYHGMR